RGGIKGLLSRNFVTLDNRQIPSAQHERTPDPIKQPKPFYRQSEVTELRIQLPRELEATPAICEQFLLSLGNISEPVAFEVIANSDAISIQAACSSEYAAYLKSQWRAFFPALSVNERKGFLVSQFRETLPAVVADFGLAKNFARPLRSFRSFNPDPLAGLISSFATLEQSEKAVFQILFQPVKGAWVDELYKTQTDQHRKLLEDHTPSFSAVLKSKLSSSLFAVTVRLMAQAVHSQRAWELIRQIGGNLRQYSDPAGNELIALSNENYPENNHVLSVLSRTNYRSGMLLNTTELASLVHLPSSSVRIEKLHRSDLRTKALPAIATGNRLVIGENTHDGQTRTATLSNKQRTRHTHIIGSTGSGKSTLLLHSIIQDVEAGEGVCVFDFHGDLIDTMCGMIPENRIRDVVLFDPADSNYPIGFNILQAHSDIEKNLISSDLVAAFKRMSTSWGDVMDAVFANAVLAILEHEGGGTLLDLKRFLIENHFRSEFLKSVGDESVRYFWLNEFPLIAGKPHASILIRLDTFLRQKMIRNIVCQKTSRLDFREIMDNRKILLIKLSQGILGIENSYLLGSLLITKLHQIALSRQDTTNRPFFAIYIDEFHNVIVPSLEASLSANRKFNISLTLSHQEWRQIQSRSLEVAASVMSNCYTRICFRLGDADARLFAGGFSTFDASALQNLGVGEAVARIERSDYDFNLRTMPITPVDPEVAHRRRLEVIEQSRRTYATAIAAIDNQPPESIPISKEKAHSESENQEQLDLVSDETEETQKAVESKINIGRAGKHHQELQATIKRVAETYGFQVQIEQVVLDGSGRVDVSLEKEDLKIACEVSVTTTDYEITNILKCLSAGYDYVIVVVSNRKKIPLLKSKIHSEIPIEHQANVKAFGLTELLGFLREISAPKATNRKTSEKPAGQRLNFAEACRFFDVKASTLYRWVREGRIPFYRPGREYQFDRDELVLIGRHDLSGKRKASVMLEPLSIDKKTPRAKKDQDSRYRKLLKLD
ncbi:MAG: type IV secretion system DNA-binding domain-containing protein, partial [Pyrinomonadaceae bacterium]